LNRGGASDRGIFHLEFMRFPSVAPQINQSINLKFKGENNEA
jgi:hypothetical protein